MTFSLSSRPRIILGALLGCAVSFGAHAQQIPITGQMGVPAAPMASANAPAATPSTTPPAPIADNTDPAPSTTEVGRTTRQLFAMQSQGTNTGPALPIPGQEASASYQRYLKSFALPIPQFYETAVSKNSGLSGSGGSP